MQAGEGHRRDAAAAKAVPIERAPGGGPGRGGGDLDGDWRSTAAIRPAPSSVGARASSSGAAERTDGRARSKLPSGGGERWPTRGCGRPTGRPGDGRRRGARAEHGGDEARQHAEADQRRWPATEMSASSRSSRRSTSGGAGRRRPRDEVGQARTGRCRASRSAAASRTADSGSGRPTIFGGPVHDAAERPRWRRRTTVRWTWAVGEDACRELEAARWRASAPTSTADEQQQEGGERRDQRARSTREPAGREAWTPSRRAARAPGARRGRPWPS